MAIVGTPIPTVLYSDGEALTSSDLMLLQKYARAHGSDGANLGLVYGLSSAFLDGQHSYDTPGAYEGMAFIKGEGLAAYFDPVRAPFEANFLPGFLGLIPGTGSSSPAYKTNAFFWTFVPGLAIPLTPAASGMLRWDIVTAKITPKNSKSEVRSHKDATTGIVTSRSFNKEETWDLDISVTSGTEAASNPALPQLPVNRALLAAFLVSSSAITDVQDHCYPLGPVQVSGRLGVDCATSVAGTFTKGITKLMTTDGIIYATPGFGVNPLARILDTRVVYGAAANDISIMELGTLWEGPSSSSFTAATSRNMGNATLSVDASMMSATPMWGSGRSHRAIGRDNVRIARESPCVRFSPNANGITVFSVDFFFVI